jgi:hypothetical protein
MFAYWAPKLHAYYKRYMDALYDKHRNLTPNFRGSIFTAATFNLGPETVCFDHRDFANLSFGWCAITALGKFNHKLGGHLILWDLGMVLEFPPGSTILIPSAVLRHSNAMIGCGETRQSFTQYTAGGLFRWVDNGFKTSKDLIAQAEGGGESEGEGGKGSGDEGGENELSSVVMEKWRMGLSLYSTVEELKARYLEGVLG